MGGGPAFPAHMAGGVRLLYWSCVWEQVLGRGRGVCPHLNVLLRAPLDLDPDLPAHQGMKGRCVCPLAAVPLASGPLPHLDAAQRWCCRRRLEGSSEQDRAAPRRLQRPSTGPWTGGPRVLCGPGLHRIACPPRQGLAWVKAHSRDLGSQLAPLESPVTPARTLPPPLTLTHSHPTLPLGPVI